MIKKTHQETHIVLKEKPPALIPPRHLCRALQTNEELPLKVQKLVQSREKVVNGVEVNCVALGQGSCISLSQCKTRETERWYGVRTCMISKSWTYLRSVSTNSLIILFLAASCAFAGTGVLGTSLINESIESWADMNGGDKGAGSNSSEGNISTMVVTVLTTCKTLEGVDGL
jgi:hypothetical protein